MLVELRYTLRRYRGQILGWGLGLTLYCLLMVSMYPDIKEMDFTVFLDYYPEDIMAFFWGEHAGHILPPRLYGFVFL